MANVFYQMINNDFAFIQANKVKVIQFLLFTGKEIKKSEMFNLQNVALMKNNSIFMEKYVTFKNRFHFTLNI